MTDYTPENNFNVIAMVKNLIFHTPHGLVLPLPLPCRYDQPCPRRWPRSARRPSSGALCTCTVPVPRPAPRKSPFCSQ